MTAAFCAVDRIPNAPDKETREPSPCPIGEDIDLAGYAHALRDNDIRHIRNSHGERTAEKYPVTKEDIKKIPWLVHNYDKVLALKRPDGKTGIIYVKAMPNGLVYYLEQVTSAYGNEPLLINKQMIKTGMNDIPELKGLREAITKKQSETEFLNDLKQVPQVYAQSVRQFHSDNSIADGSQDVKQVQEQDVATISSLEALAWVLDKKELQQIDPRTRGVLREYGRHLQQLEKIRDLQSRLQSTGTDASTSQAAQRKNTKLERLYAHHTQRLTQLEKNPRLQRLAQKTLEEIPPAEPRSVDSHLNAADMEALCALGGRSEDDLQAIVKRGTIKIQSGFASFPDGDPLNENIKHVIPEDHYFDVGMHGTPTGVCFGTENVNMSARLLANLIRHSEGYHGQKIRLLSCSTGESVNGGVCFAEELANALGVEVVAPNKAIYIFPDGVLQIGKGADGQFITYKPNQRRRIK